MSGKSNLRSDRRQERRARARSRFKIQTMTERFGKLDGSVPPELQEAYDAYVKRKLVEAKSLKVQGYSG